MTTLKQIARDAGVDVSVVSRALNPKPDMHARIAPATRNKIRTIANRLNYRPNRAAEFLKRGQIPAIGAFMPPFAPTLFKELVIGIASTAEEAGFPVHFNFDMTPDSYRKFLKHTPDLSHCGLITSPYSEQAELTNRIMKRFQQASGQLVAVHYQLDLPGVCTVAVDDIEGGRMAARHLLKRGCKSCFGYGFPSSLSPGNWRKNRLLGFREAMAETGINPPILDESEKNIKTICMSARHTDSKPTGVFCASDRDAVRLMSHIQKAGLSVGRDVLIIGYDDLYLTSDISPALTTIRQPMREIGAIATTKVLKMIYGKKENSTLIKPTLTARESA